MNIRRANSVFGISLAAVLMSTLPAFAGGDIVELQSDGPGYSDWGGLYVGIHGGYGWGDQSSSYDFGSADANDFIIDHAGLSSGLNTDLEGSLFGGQVGIQKQFGSIVLGIEGSYSASLMDGSANANWGFNDIVCPFGCFGIAADGTQSLDVDVDNIFTLAGRVGYAADLWMVYVKGGYASADIDVGSGISGVGTVCVVLCGSAPINASGDSDKRHDGWMLGAGFERKLHPNVTLGVEYNYIDLNARTHSIDAPLEIGPIDIPGGYSVRVDPDAIHTVSLRLNLKLDKPDEPVVAAPLK